MKPLYAIACALSFCFASTHADEAEDRTTLTKLEEKSAALLAVNDATGLGELLAADWQLVLSEGETMTRERFLRMLKSGQLKFSASSVRDLGIRIYGDAAVVIGTSTSRGTWEGQEFSGHDRFTDVFIRKNGQWLCVSSHNSDMPESR